MLTLTNSDRKRRIELNDVAIKDAVNSAKSLQIAAASGMYMLMHGHSEFINDLYFRLAEESAKDAYALRSMYAPKVIDTFGLGGVRRIDDANTWAKRPTPFFQFSNQKPEGSDKIKGFVLIDVKNNTTLTAQQIAEIKTARRNIREMGEKALNFVWRDADKEKRDAEAFDASKMQSAARALLLRAAKNAHIDGITKGGISAAGKAFGLSSDAITKVLENFNDGTIDGADLKDEDDEMESGVFFKDDEPEAETPKPAKKPAKEHQAAAH